MRKKLLKELDTFVNPNPERDYEIEMECPEFTCLCPKTGQPDFATIMIQYIPDKLCIELKSLKLYLWAYRDKGTFHEAVINQVLDDFSKACKPRYLKVSGKFLIRGGINTSVKVEYFGKGLNKKKKSY